MPVVLAPGTAEATSVDITVNSGSPVPVSLYTTTGGDIPSGVVCQLLRRTAAGNFMELSTVGIGAIVLTGQSRMLVISTPGVYRVRRPDIAEYVVQVGVETD